MAQSIAYQVIRSGRKTLCLELRPDGTLLVRSPRGLSDGQIRSFVLSRQRWIETHRKKYTLAPALPPLTREELESLARDAEAWFPARVKILAPRVGVTFGRITIRAQHTRWGSCSSIGNLNFNCLLMLAPESVREYVVIHELCHRKHMNHSPEFWSAVAQILPDYSVAKQWLKDNGGSLLARLPR